MNRTSIFCVLLLLFHGVSAKAEPPDVDSFLTAYRRDLKTIQSAYRSIVFKTEFAFEDVSRRPEVSTYMANGDCVRRDQGGASVIASPRRSFAVTPTGENGVFILRRIGNTREAYKIELSQIHLTSELIAFPTTFLEFQLEDVFYNNPAFKIKKIEATTVSDQQSFSVELEETLEDGSVRTDTFWFPLAHPWVVLKREVAVKDRGRVWIADYSDSVSGVPVPTELVCFLQNDGKLRKYYSIKTVELDKKPPPLSEFRLERFGIEDTFGPRSNFNVVWVLACGLCCIALGIWIRKLVRNA